MDIREVQQRLNDNGFPCGAVDGTLGPATKAAVTRFQYACNTVGWLVPDGIPGPNTQAGLAALPHLSPNFVVDELKSAGNGNCWVRRELLASLETMRAKLGRPIPIRDAYRDPAHNAAVGGAKDSMHMFGLAADLFDTTGLHVDWVQGLKLFAGIGDKDNVVLHVDCRQNAGSNNHTPGATPASPARWHY